MAKYIDADEAMQIINNYAKAIDYDCDNCKVVIDAIKDIVSVICPTADVVEVKHGKWKKETKFIITDDPDDDGYWRTIYICSECEREEWRKEPYCHCGAKMDGGMRNDL